MCGRQQVALACRESGESLVKPSHGCGGRELCCRLLASQFHFNCYRSVKGRQHPSRSPAPHGPLAILGGVWYGQSAASVRSFDVPDDPSDIPRNPGPSKIERLPGSCLCGAASMHLVRNSIQLHSVDIRLLYAAAASKTSQQPSSLHPFIEPSSICLDGLCGQMLLWKSAQPVPLHRYVTQHGCRDGNGVSFQGNGTLTNTIWRNPIFTPSSKFPIVLKIGDDRHCHHCAMLGAGEQVQKLVFSLRDLA